MTAEVLAARAAAPAPRGTGRGPLMREHFFRFLEEQGITHFFGNPGTTELPLVDGVSDHPSIRYVLALHEDVAVAMAMGFSRTSGKPGVVNLHVAPGLSHGFGNLYNAWRSRMPLVVTVGQHDTSLLLHEPILAADLAAMARPFTKWAYDVRRPDELRTALQRAFKEVMTPPVSPVFLSFPTDVLLAPLQGELNGAVSKIGAVYAALEAVEEAAAAVASARHPIVIAGDGVGLADAWTEVAAIAETIGAPVLTEELSTLWNFPSDHPHYAGVLPNVSAPMRAKFDGVDLALFIGFTSQAPVSRHDSAGPLVPAAVRVVAVHDSEWEIGKNQAVEVGLLGDIKHNAAALAEALHGATRGKGTEISERAKGVRAASAKRAAQSKAKALAARQAQSLSATLVGAELADALPPRSIMVEEAISNREPFVSLAKFSDPLAYFGAKGLSLGHSGGAAVGIKLGARDRTVVNVVGDGSFMYYPQALWSAANVGAPVLFLVINNGAYRVLKVILSRWGGPWGEGTALPPGLNFGEPVIDFVVMANSMGVAGERVSTPSELREAIERGLSAGAPYLLDIRIEQPDGVPASA
jgi:benzoylformate decarboxylase